MFDPVVLDINFLRQTVLRLLVATCKVVPLLLLLLFLLLYAIRLVGWLKHCKLPVWGVSGTVR